MTVLTPQQIADQKAFNAARKPVNDARADGLLNEAQKLPSHALLPIDRAAVTRAVAAGTTYTPATNTDITNLLANAKATDTVILDPAGTYRSNAVPFAGKLQGTRGKSKLLFATGGNFALSAAASAIFQDAMLENNGGLIIFPNGMNGAQITGCGIKFGGSGQNAVGVRSLNGTNNFTIEDNYLTQPIGDATYRALDLWGITGNSSCAHNWYENITYGPHLIIQDGLLNYIGNTGTGWDQMAVEIQDFGIVRGKGAVHSEGNIDYGWRTGNSGGQNNAFGASFGTQFTGSFTSLNDYTALGLWDANGNYFENPRHGGDHWGYGKETGGFDVCSVTGATIVGSWCQGLVIMTANGVMLRVRVYGSQIWGPWGDEGGNLGEGKWASITDCIGNLPIDKNTPRPARIVSMQNWLAAASGNSGGGTTTTGPTMNLVLTPSTNGNFLYQIVNPVGTGGTMFVKDAKAKAIGASFPLTANAGEITGNPLGWDLLVSVRQNVNGANTDASASVHTGGTSAVDWNSQYNLQPAVKPATTTTPPASDPIVEVDVKHQSGKVDVSKP